MEGYQRVICDDEMAFISKLRRIKWTKKNQEALYKFYFTPLLDPKIIEYLSTLQGKVLSYFFKKQLYVLKKKVKYVHLCFFSGDPTIASEDVCDSEPVEKKAKGTISGDGST